MRKQEDILNEIDCEDTSVDSRGDEYTYTDMELVALRAIAEVLCDIRGILAKKEVGDGD